MPAVRRCVPGDFARQHAGSTRTVVDDDLLAKHLRQTRRENPRETVGRAAGCRRDDKTDGLDRIVLRRSSQGKTGRRERERQAEPAHVTEGVHGG